MRNFSFQKMFEDPEEQENLAECLEAFRLLIDFYPSPKILATLQDNFYDIIDLLLVQNLNGHIKNQIIYLLDSVIFFDEKGELTDDLIRNRSLFSKIWGYNDDSIIGTKLNIINNMLLYPSGFHAVDRHLCQIVIFLEST